MERKEYRFIKNILWPVKSTIVVDDTGITNNKKFMAWDNIEEFVYSVNIINGARNYIFAIDGKDGSKMNLNFMVAITGGGKKKEKMADLYSTLHEQLHDRFIFPQVEEAKKTVAGGGTVEFAGVSIGPSGVTIKKGMMKKEPVDLDWEDVVFGYVDGGAIINSKLNPKDSMHIDAGKLHARHLYAFMHDKLKKEIEA